MEFWDEHHFDFDDALNQRIWRESPALQQTIQTPGDLRHEGAIGAQQAMIEPPRATYVSEEGSINDNAPEASRSSHDELDGVLPWVPDLLGKHWQERESVLVIGSAYAPFIREFSRRGGCLSLDDYATAADAAQFQHRFLKSVVQRDHSYYGKIADIVGSNFDASRLLVFDLCRASFVRRRTDVRKGRSDKGGDLVVRAACRLYAQYAESPPISDWTWERLNATQSYRILPLGTIAEHGVLRLFSSRGATITHSEDPAIIFGKRGGKSAGLDNLDGKWVSSHAHSAWKLKDWQSSSGFWIASLGEREWHIRPIKHPSGHGNLTTAHHFLS